MPKITPGAILLTIVIMISFHHCSFAQQDVTKLVEQYHFLLHPTSEASGNSLEYTQRYVELKKKIESLNPDEKTAFENGISKYEADTGYTRLHAMLFSETTGQGDTLQIKEGGKVVSATAANDSTIQWQVYDKRHKLVQTVKLKPADVENKMKSDGYVVSISSYDFNLKTVSVNLVRSDGTGNAVKVTFPATGDCDMKYKLDQGRSLTLHSTATGTSTLHVTETKKSSVKK